MTKEEFPRRLREWRTANGLIQKELAEKSGISCRQIQNYEHGTSFPSVEAGRRLVALGFDPAYLPEGVHRVRCPDINAPLTDEEQQFAAKKHGLVYWFLNWAGLSQDEWYDIIAIGYLQAVKKWFARPEIHCFSFSTIAKKAMKNSVRLEREKQSRLPRTVSLDDIIPGTEGMTYGETLCDPRDCVRT